jgi:hypothetical protein
VHTVLQYRPAFLYLFLDEVCSGTTPSLKLNQTELARPSPYPNTSIPRIGISYSSTSVPYERYPSHIRTFADHRRRRPSARSPLSLSNLAATAARQSGEGIVRQSCGCPVRLSRQSGGRHKTVRRPTQDSPAANTRKAGAIAGAARQSGTGIARQSVRCLARLPRQSGGLRETVRRDRRRGQRRTVWPRRALRACRRQPSQHKPARHGRGCACGRPTPPAILPAHQPPRGRVTVDNIRSCLYPYVCYIYVQFFF